MNSHSTTCKFLGIALSTKLKPLSSTLVPLVKYFPPAQILLHNGRRKQDLAKCAAQQIAHSVEPRVFARETVVLDSSVS